MKLKAIQTYQYARFQGKNENFFCADKPDMKDLELEYLGEGQVSVKTAKDHIIIYTTNISYAVPLTAATKAKKMVTNGTLANVPTGTGIGSNTKPNG